ncbi:hypothetical protein FG264_14800 [Listeria monocytogenes]|nr:hypothetical protein [Listeria monocytogenes]
MTTPEKSKEWYEQELKLRFRHFYGQTDGTYDFPNSLEGDLLKMTFKMIYLPSAENCCKTCDGTGFVKQFIVDNQYEGESFKKSQYTTCAKCSGSGLKTVEEKLW